jgi:hypothetical protein
MGDEEIGMGRDAVAEDGRTLGGAHAAHIGKVLDGHGEPGEHAPL